VGVDHPAYTENTQVSAATKQILIRDFREDLALA
jgi:hypothetical protein